MTEQPVRHTADTITDNDLDALYAEIVALAVERARYRLAWIGARRRAYNSRAAWRTWFRLANKRKADAKQAEAAIARVREVAAWISANYPGLDHDHRILAALDKPKES